MTGHFFVYIMSNKSKTLYIGYTNDLFGRVMEHKQRRGSDFTARYNITKLLYWETYETSEAALKRERQLKGWMRTMKVALISTMNRNSRDLSGGWENKRSFAEAFVSTRQRHSVNRIVDGLMIAGQLLANSKN